MEYVVNMKIRNVSRDRGEKTRRCTEKYREICLYTQVYMCMNVYAQPGRNNIPIKINYLDARIAVE